jgi:heme A synthase
LSADIYSTKGTLLSAAFLVPLFVLGFAGMWISRKDPRMREVLILFVILMLFVTAVHTVLVSTIRLRLPSVDPFLTIFAAIAIVTILSRFWTERLDRVNQFLEGSH